MIGMEPMDDEPSSPGPPPLEDQNGMEVTAPVQKSAKVIQGEIKQRLEKEKERKKLDLVALNPYIMCAVCKGYLIDPVTVVECLHSFCKSCIVKHVDGSKACPSCGVQIHKTKPLLSLRADKALQDIVYKVVPGLYRTEMKNRVNFYNNHPEAEPASLEDAGEITDRLFFSPEDDISMSIEYFDSYSKPDEMNKPRTENMDAENQNRRFLQCPGSVTVNHLKKFIITKYGLDQSFLVDVIYKEDLLSQDQTLIDIAYSYNWRKTSPMQFYYRIYQKTKVLTRKRKKKRTKAGSKSQPAKKQRRNMDSSWTGTKENGMEVDEESIPKISSKIEKSGTEKSTKLKITLSRDTDKKLKTDSSVLSKSERKVPTTSYSLVNPQKKPQESKPSPGVNQLQSRPVTKTISSVKESSSVTVSSARGGQGSNQINSLPPQTSKKSLIEPKPLQSNKPTPPPPQTQPTIRPQSKNINSKPTKVPKEPTNLNSAPEPRREKILPTPGPKTEIASKKSDKTVTPKVSTNQETSPHKLVMAENKKGEKEVVEISVEVSASDVKKVLEKKRAEKDAKLITSGEEKLYSNYSIVDQIKKAGSSAANLARQQTERASMMDFARSSDALNAPKVPPTIQGLQPKVTSNSETNALSAIVQSLAQKQQKLQSSILESQEKKRESSPALSKPSDLTGSDSSSKPKQSEKTKTLGTIVAPSLSSLSSSIEKINGGKPQTPKLPVSTSIKPILKDGKHSPTAVETSGLKGQQMLNFYKNNFKTNSLLDAAKSAETLTKNIPAGTTVTVKTVDNKPSGKSSPLTCSSPASTPTLSSSPKTSAFKATISSPMFSTAKPITNPFSSVGPVSQPSLMNPFVHSSLRDSMTMALQQAQYLNFSNQLAAAQMEAATYVQAAQAASLVRAAQAASQISQSPLTTLAFTKPTMSPDDGRYGLKIPTPSRQQHIPPVSGFGTSRLQVKVNPDSPKDGSPRNSPSPAVHLPASVGTSEANGTSSNGKSSGTHCMPAILPFHSVKKVHALPKTTTQTPRPVSVSSLLKTQTSSNTKSPELNGSPPTTPKSVTFSNSIQSLTESNPFKTLAPAKAPSIDGLKKVSNTPAIMNNPFKTVTTAQVNSLKKLAADLNTVQQKTQKGDNNILNCLKKNNENKLMGDLKHFGLEKKKKDVSKEVTSS